MPSCWEIVSKFPRDSFSEAVWIGRAGFQFSADHGELILLYLDTMVAMPLAR